MFKLFNCEVCQKESIARYEGKKYCSQTCMGSVYSVKYRKPHLCKCGCGESVYKETEKVGFKVYIVGHQRVKRDYSTYPKGEQNKNWRGGWVNRLGYHCQKVYVDGKAKEVLTHRLIMEQILGRKLAKGEVVDHIDNNKSNNDPNNLRLCKNNAENTRYYWGITQHDLDLVVQRFKQGMSYRACISGTGIKSIGTVHRLAKREGLL